MTKYFFDLQNGDGFTKDTDGRQLPNQTAAHREVAAILIDLAGDELNGYDPFKAEVTVRDEHESIVFKGSLAFQIEN